MPSFLNKPISIVHQYTNSIVFSLFIKIGINFDRNTVSNGHHLTRLGQNSFP